MLRKSLAFVVVALLLAAGASAQSVGLVLSGGGAKGLYHIGVIQALEENEKLKNEAKQAEHEKELSTIRANVAAKHGITDPSVLAGDDEKQIGEYAEKLMKVFADMRSRGTVADQSARTGQAKAKHSSREDFVNAMSNTLL